LKTKVKLYLHHTPSPSGEGWGEVRRGFFTHGYSHLIPSGSGKSKTKFYLSSGLNSRIYLSVLKTKVKLYLDHTPSPPGEGLGEVREDWGEVKKPITNSTQ